MEALNSTPAGTTAADSSGSGNSGTLTNFNFDNTSGWVANTSLLHASTEPTVTATNLELETPIFYEWRQAGGTFSTRAQTPYTDTQLGSEGVYVHFNPEGKYSRQDYYMIPSWATEAFSTSAPARGKRRSFPSKANLIADASGLDVIDATTNKLWMRIPIAASNLLGNTAVKSVAALNGHLYLGQNGSGMVDIDLGHDTATRYDSTGVATYASNLANSNAASGYGTPVGAALVSSTVNGVSAAVTTQSTGPDQEVSLATTGGITLIQNSTVARTGATHNGILNNGPTWILGIAGML